MPLTYPYSTILFMLRLWPEEVAADQFEWRGEVKKLADGQTRYFRDWPALVDWIGQMLEEEPLMGKIMRNEEYGKHE